MPTSAVASLDFTTVITNVGVFIAALAATGAAIWQTAKKIRDTPPADTGTKIVGGHIMDTTTLLMWSESNRDVCDCMRELKDEMKELRFEMERNRMLRGK